MRTRLPSGAGFSLRFFGYVLLFCIIFWWGSLHENLGPVQRTMASWSTHGQQWVGGHAVARGDNVVIGSMVMNINHECTGVFVYMLFISFVLAYPVHWTARAAGLAVGVPLMFVVNVVRLATLARVAEIYPQAFFYLHEYVWQGVFTVLVLVGAIAWAEHCE